MFIMTDDGGPVENDILRRSERALTQRTLIYEFLSRGIAVALMRGAEFKDSKVSSGGMVAGC
jgi:ATP-dependent RNA helicase DDX60